MDRRRRRRGEFGPAAARRRDSRAVAADGERRRGRPGGGEGIGGLWRSWRGDSTKKWSIRDSDFRVRGASNGKNENEGQNYERSEKIILLEIKIRTRLQRERPLWLALSSGENPPLLASFPFMERPYPHARRQGTRQKEKKVRWENFRSAIIKVLSEKKVMAKLVSKNKIVCSPKSNMILFAWKHYNRNIIVCLQLLLE
jgi:hypothetical protein